MTTIQMPIAIQGAIQSMCEDAISQAVAALSEKYSFDAEEARRELNLSKITVKAGSATTKGKSKQTDDKPKTKRGPTGYLMYTASMRPEVKAELEAALGEGEKLKPQSVVTQLAAKWKALSDDDRAEWNEKAKASSPAQSESEEEKAEPKAKTEPKAKAESKAKAKSEPKAKAESKKDKGETSTAPKEKKQTGYLLFAKEKRSEIKAELEAELEEGEKLSPPKVVTAIAAAWKALDDEERAEWNEKAKPSSSGSESD
tara:strand:+ start:322 stop:1092 length:771 start_codon:yes stop_codon:yes gene_type:complete